MESKNPAVRAKTFDFTREELASGTMTMNGAVNKTGILLTILIACAAVGWQLQNPLIALVGAIFGFIAALVVIFKRTSAPYVAPIYAALEGLMIGTVSANINLAYPGIALNAMTLTFVVFALMLATYKMGVLRATPTFKKVVVFATLSIAILYLVDLVMLFFGTRVPMIHEATPVGIGFSVIVTGVAALNLILDFDRIERHAEQSPRYMEWYCGFSLVVTLVWLYVEMLRLLSKLNKK